MVKAHSRGRVALEAPTVLQFIRAITMWFLQLYEPTRID